MIALVASVLLVAGCAAPGSVGTSVAVAARATGSPSPGQTIDAPAPAPAATISTARARTTEPAASTGSDPSAAARDAMEHVLDSLPVYPDAEIVDAAGAEVQIRPSVDGWNFLARRWHVDAPAARVSSWYASRLDINGTIGTGTAVTWMVGSGTTPEPALFAGQLLVAVRGDGAGSTITATSGGAPVPARTDASRIPAADLNSGSVDVRPLCSSEPTGAGPDHLTHIALPTADRDRLVLLLNSAPAQPSFESGGLGCGYELTLTFAVAGGTSYVVSYDSSHPTFGAVLHFGPAAQRSLRPATAFYSLLQHATGVLLR